MNGSNGARTSEPHSQIFSFHGGNIMYHRGFTLLELLITLIILALILTMGIPNFSKQLHNTRLKTTTLSLLEAVAATRTQAVSINKRATLKHQGTWEDGWEAFIDRNNNGLRDEEEKLFLSHEKIQDIRITANRPLKNYISFIGSGESRFVGGNNSGAFQAGTFKICPKKTGAGYELTLARSGRMRMNEISAAKCNEK
jgi:type IV fimbrial biogenesis protein FimT